MAATLRYARWLQRACEIRRYGVVRFDRCSSLGVAFCACRLPIRHLGNTMSVTPARSRASAARSVAAMPAPHWFFRFMYDRESAAWERRRDQPEQRELVKRTAALGRDVGEPAHLGVGPLVVGRHGDHLGDALHHRDHLQQVLPGPL
jgi:hypothetical protein